MRTSGEGDKKSKSFADVINGWSPRAPASRRRSFIIKGKAPLKFLLPFCSHWYQLTGHRFYSLHLSKHFLQASFCDHSSFFGARAVSVRTRLTCWLVEHVGYTPEKNRRRTFCFSPSNPIFSNILFRCEEASMLFSFHIPLLWLVELEKQYVQNLCM